MFNHKSSKKSSHVSVVKDNFTPATLPHHGDPDLTTFIPSSYSLNSDEFVKQIHANCDAQIDALIQSSDKHTMGEVFDPFIDAQVNHLKSKHQVEVAQHEFQLERINQSQIVRKRELEESIQGLHDEIDDLSAKIEPLKGKCARFPRWLITLFIVMAIIAETIVNYSYLDPLLFSDQRLLLVSVLSLTFIGTIPMIVLGHLLSSPSQESSPSWMRKAEIGTLITLFVISAIGVLLLRMGSMNTVLSTAFDLNGNAVEKTNFSLGDYSITCLTSLVTPAIGLVTFILTRDPNRAAEDLRHKLENQRSKLLNRKQILQSEAIALENAVNTTDYDTKLQYAAESNLEFLTTSLKIHARKHLISHHQDPSVLDAMAISATNVAKQEINGSQRHQHFMSSSTPIEIKFKKEVM